MDRPVRIRFHPLQSESSSLRENQSDLVFTEGTAETIAIAFGPLDRLD